MGQVSKTCYNRSSIIINIRKYGLQKGGVETVLLRDLYVQYTPNIPEIYNNFFMDKNVLDPHMINSPHKHIADLYFKKGQRWLQKNYKKTPYYKMFVEVMGKKDISIQKFACLCESMKKGYLGGRYKKDHIVVLKNSFAVTRYGRTLPFDMDGYEIFMGHHRSGILLSLGILEEAVLVAVDVEVGTCNSYGKIHNLCKGN